MSRQGDVVLIYYQDKPSVYARIESIEPDLKKDWYHVTLLLLTVPAQPVTWILRSAYIAGEAFTMGGVPMRVEAVERAALTAEHGPGAGRKDSHPGSGGTVIPFKKP